MENLKTRLAAADTGLFIDDITEVREGASSERPGEQRWNRPWQTAQLFVPPSSILPPPPPPPPPLPLFPLLLTSLAASLLRGGVECHLQCGPNVAEKQGQESRSLRQTEHRCRTARGGAGMRLAGFLLEEHQGYRHSTAARGRESSSSYFVNAAAAVGDVYRSNFPISLDVKAESHIKTDPLAFDSH
ncbi:unnamed protein product [Pleuronectes platessa]|uniref:Uncharacterized protein n=1 Tax=Pleuronectes platessa TaxID=8262 RepID=A0A9N7VI62_PLEPL|nr:unnamed protein product [Pleuronectes platessa]